MGAVSEESKLSFKKNRIRSVCGMRTPCDSMRSSFVRVFHCCCWIRLHSWFSMSLSFFKMNVNNSIPIDNRIIESMTVLSAQYAIESQFVHICFESFVNF